MKRKAELRISSDATALFESATEDFYQHAKKCIQEKDFFSVVFSGGETAKYFFDSIVRLNDNHIDWQKIHCFFADERYLPIDDPENNYHNANIHFFSHVDIPAENIHRIPTEFDNPDDAAIAYQSTLCDFFQITLNESPTFDLIYLGLGDDAHTASLMPGSALVLKYSQKISNQEFVSALHDPKRGTRITLTPTAINPSECIIFMVSGTNKAYAVHQVLEGVSQPEKYPGQLIQCLHRPNIWYLDQEAAAQLLEAI